MAVLPFLTSSCQQKALQLQGTDACLLEMIIMVMMSRTDGHILPYQQYKTCTYRHISNTACIAMLALQDVHAPP
jgi:hypothetical protein